MYVKWFFRNETAKRNEKKNWREYRATWVKKWFFSLAAIFLWPNTHTQYLIYELIEFGVLFFIRFTFLMRSDQFGIIGNIYRTKKWQSFSIMKNKLCRDYDMYTKGY